MKRTQHIHDDPPHIALEQAESAARSVSAPTHSERRRWQVINLLTTGTAMDEIVTATGYQPRTIRRIAQRYRESGAAGLVDGRQRSLGALPLLSIEQQHELRQVLQHPPTDGGVWTGTQVAQWIAIKIGRGVRRQRGWDYLRRLGTDTTEVLSPPDTQSAAS